MDRELAYDLLDLALHINDLDGASRSRDEVIVLVSEYIDSNYSHDFSIEEDADGKYFPFLYERFDY